MRHTLHGSKHISIHAPVKGATRRSKTNGNYNAISIHAPVKGATCWLAALATTTTISIHAPVKGATVNFAFWVFSSFYFNPRSREGSDGKLRLLGVQLVLFQSTLP